MKIQKRGFTIIELLVVVAIISLLATIVIFSLNNAQNKGADSAIKSDLASVRNQIELYSITNGYFASSTYVENQCASNVSSGNFLADQIIKDALNHANTVSSGSITSNMYTNTRCAISSTSYAIAISLKEDPNTAWCIDSSSASKQTSVNASSSSSITGTGTSADPYICGN